MVVACHALTADRTGTGTGGLGIGRGVDIGIRYRLEVHPWATGIG